MRNPFALIKMYYAIGVSVSSLHRESTDSRAVSLAGLTFIYTKYVHALTPISQHALSIKDYVLGSALILDVALQYVSCRGKL